jgi:hypothetical protein
MSLSIIRRPRLALAGLAVLAGIMVAGLAGGASPASATVCRTLGHAYLTQPGRVIFSGYQGVPFANPPTTVSYVSGSAQGEFRFGGNGIFPRTPIKFSVTNLATGQVFTGLTPNAGSNCVVNEVSNVLPLRVLPPGTWQVRATYSAVGASVIDEPVANLNVLNFF